MRIRIVFERLHLHLFAPILVYSFSRISKIKVNDQIQLQNAKT